MNSNIVKFRVSSADWSMTMGVDSEIFDDLYIEAGTRCIEEKMKTSLDKGDDFLLNPIITVSPVIKKYGKSKILNSYKILINAGMPSRAEMLREVFYMNSNVDLATEPISSSKY